MKSSAFGIALAGSVLALAGLTATSALAQNACTAYEHANYKGKSFGVAANGGATNSKLNNNISAFKMVRGCSVVAYSEANYRGPSVKWTKNVAFVGKQWNDVISSYQCVCK